MRPRDPVSPSLTPRRRPGRGVTGVRSFSLLARLLGRATGLLVALAVVPASLDAQSSGPVTLSASVVAPLSVSPVAPLDFGVAKRNRTTTVAYSDVGAGQLVLTATPGAQVQLQWTLPTQLATLAGSTIPLSAWTGCHNATQSATTGCTVYTPSSTPFTVTLTSGSRYFYIGASVSTTNATPTGSYAATIQLSAAYAGN